MNPRDLDRLLHQTSGPLPPGAEDPDFTDTLLRKLPKVRFVIPGSLPGRHILVVAGMLGLATAAGISFYRRHGEESFPLPPPFTLFQPGAVEPQPASPSP